jgi:glycosidase
LARSIRDGYFDQLGVRAIWLSPFNTNPDAGYGAADGVHTVSGYHGYWPIHPRDVEPRIGGPSALEELVDAAHDHGIRVLMDLVVNHVHEDHPYYADHPEWFNSGCLCGTSGCDWTERRLDCLFRNYMPDVDWENADASEQFIADALWWLERFDLDGFRIDAVKHVVDGSVFNTAIRVRERFETAGTRYFLMGETAQGWDSSAGPTEGGNVDNYGIISRYIAPHGLDGQFDFVLYYAASLQFLGDAPGRGMLHVDYWTRASQDQYPAGAIMTPYIGSHDSSRWISLQASPGQANNQWSDLPGEPTSIEPYDRMYVALAWLFAIPGAPLLYMGDEYGEYGGADPDNRHMMRFGPDLSVRESVQLARVRRLGRARADLPGLSRGAYLTLHVTETFWSIARGTGADLVLVALNRSGTPTTQSIPVSAVAADGRTFTDALGTGTTATVSGGNLSVTLPARSAVYLR